MGKVKKRWLPEEIAQATQLIAEGSSLRKVSKVSGIRKETLRRHVSRPIQKTGRRSALCKRDEEQLIAYASFVAASGNPITPQWLCETATRILKERYDTLELFLFVQKQFNFLLWIYTMSL